MIHILKRASLLVAICGLLTTTGFSADVGGKWAGDVSTPDGQSITLTLNLKIDGDKLTGTITGPTGDIEISEGKTTGDTLSFVLSVDAGGQQLVFKVSGKLASDDQLNLKMDGGGDLNLEFTAKRQAT